MRDSPANQLETALTRLARQVAKARDLPPAHSKTAKIMSQGRKKAAKKVIEEAAEVAMEGYAGHHGRLVVESADLLYNLSVLWVMNGVSLSDIAAEMQKREDMLGIAEKWPKKKSRDSLRSVR